PLGSESRRRPSPAALRAATSPARGEVDSWKPPSHQCACHGVAHYGRLLHNRTPESPSPRRNTMRRIFALLALVLAAAAGPASAAAAAERFSILELEQL